MTSRYDGGMAYPPKDAQCSFCTKSQEQVKKLIAGPGVFICDQCVDLCHEIIAQELSGGAQRP